MKRVVLFGGSFNPPGLHHKKIAEALAPLFDEVVVLPCGPRPDRDSREQIDPIFRAAMVDMTFRGTPKVTVDLSDLEEDEFTRAIDLDRERGHGVELWHLVGTDLITGGAKGEASIQKNWKDGATLWKTARFAVANRVGFPIKTEDLPPHHQVVEVDIPGSSSLIRHEIGSGKDIKAFVTPEVASYIERHGLYRGTRPSKTTELTVSKIEPLVFVDTKNPEATKMAAALRVTQTQNPNLLLAIGGDGFMLRTIRENWRRRVPFYGMNAGHLGFLLNELPSSLLPKKHLTLHQLPLLRIETEDAAGNTATHLAFNDAWIERASGQTSWIKVIVNGKERIPVLMADAALVSTAAGSASYARAMGAPALPFNTPSLLLVGSNVLRPIGWKSAVLPLDTRIEFRALEPQKRPMQAFIDGIPSGPVVRMRIRISRTAAVELTFDPEHDPAEKLAKIQFPAI